MALISSFPFIFITSMIFMTFSTDALPPDYCANYALQMLSRPPHGPGEMNQLTASGDGTADFDGERSRRQFPSATGQFQRSLLTLFNECLLSGDGIRYKRSLTWFPLKGLIHGPSSPRGSSKSLPTIKGDHVNKLWNPADLY